MYAFTVIACGVPPPPPLQGGYGFTGMMFGDTVTYDCECGYDLDGKQSLTCGVDGKWGEPPCCRSKYGYLFKHVFLHKIMYVYGTQRRYTVSKL